MTGWKCPHCGEKDNVRGGETFFKEERICCHCDKADTDPVEGEQMTEKQHPVLMADKHWEWVKDLIFTLDDSQNVPIDTAEYLYRTAFEHGFKHGVESVA